MHSHLPAPPTFGGFLDKCPAVGKTCFSKESELVVPLPYSHRVFASSWLVAITTGGTVNGRAVGGVASG